MILSFNPEIFLSNDGDLLKKLSQIFDLITLDRKLIDLVDIDSFYATVYDENGEYIFDEGKFSINVLSEFDRRKLRDFFSVLIQEGVYIDGYRKKYLTAVKIGLEPNEIQPELAYKILSIPSKIIVENATHDWKFISGIVTKYAKHKKRRSIYMFIKRSLDSLYLLAEQAGGKGQIRARFEDLRKNQYKDIYQFKLMALFDSDRESNTYLNHEVNLLINYLKNREVDYIGAYHEESDVIIWHMLYKREIENYVPLDVITSSLPLTPIEADELTLKSAEEIDFLDYEDYLKFNPGKINVKREFPELFHRDWTRDKLEQRCEPLKDNIELPNGTLETVSEIEKILLKITKII